MEMFTKLPLILRLGRLHMTQFSAVTYFTSSVVACEIVQDSVKWYSFVIGYVFVLACQMVAHFLGEYYDQDSDRLNLYGSRLTGGSGVLNAKAINPKISLYVGWGFSVFCLVWALVVLPNHVTQISIVMLLIAHQYSAPPFKLNHHSLGEIAAVTVQNVLLPTFAAMLQSNKFSTPLDYRLNHLIWPSAFVKFALFIVLNLNDRRPDWLTDKTTLPIQIGEDRAIILHTISMSAAYVFAWNAMPFSVMKVLALGSAPLAFWISLQMWINRPYRYDHILALSLLHCTSIMWSILIDCLIRRSRSASFDWILVVGVVMAFNFVKSCRAFLAVSKVKSQSQCPRPPITISGAGIAGLVSAIVLHRLKIPFILIEQRDATSDVDGADLALWPSAAKILLTLGIKESFLENNSGCVNVVLMRQMHDGKTLQTVDMKAVTSNTSGQFRLISRRLLMTELKKLVPSEHFLYQTKLIAIDNSGTNTHVNVVVGRSDGTFEQTRTITTRLLIGADGVHSAVRRLTLPECGIAVRYCGEMCYRGVIDFSRFRDDHAAVSDAFGSLLKDIPKDAMLITYGNGIRASAGFLDNGNMSKGYWWIKQVSKEKEDSPDTSSWPVALKTLFTMTPKDSLYAHEIIDSKSTSRRISSHCSVLLGDAAHPVTPNMGQGACMAIEDAFILCTNIGFYDEYVDGDIEACYQYEISRKSHTAAIARSSYIQSKIGQLSNPILVWIRNNILYNLPKTIIINQLRANNFDITHHLNSFRNQIASAEG